MGRQCAVTGKKTTVGRRIVARVSQRKRRNWVACNECDKAYVQAKPTTR